LLTGQAAAELMLEAGLGILRTLPQADRKAVDRLRRTAKALGIDWGESLSYADVIRTLDPELPAHAAFLVESTVLLRGSGYEAFDGKAPAHPVHAGIGAPYAHATAPLRRLVDRYVGEVCVALCADTQVPDWARSALPELPESMGQSDRHAQQYEAGIVSAVEAAVLAGSVGQEFDAVVVEVDEHDGGGVVQLVDPAVTARCEGDVPLGERVRVRLTLADVARRQVRFELA
jgi:exoribonuclease R